MRTGWIVPVLAVVVAAGCSAGGEIEGSPKVEGSQSDPPSLAELLPDASDYPADVTVDRATRQQLVEGTAPTLSPADCNDLFRTANDDRKQLFESANDAVGNRATSSDSYFSATVVLVDAPGDLGSERDFVEQCESTEVQFDPSTAGTRQVEVLDLPKAVTEADGVTDTLFAQFDDQTRDAAITTSSTTFTANAVVDGVSIFMDATYYTGVSDNGTFTPLRDADRGRVADMLESLIDSVSTTS